jgi:uncharacterized protein YebE (UPF0316 family)
MSDALITWVGVFKWVIMPLLIICARICDVTMGTIRIIAIARGKRYLATMLGFFEVIIWLVAIGQIMRHLTNVLYYIAYAGGFAAGTFVGMYVEEKLAMGVLIVRIITSRDASELIAFLRDANYGVTAVDARGAEEPVNIIFTIIRRSDLPAVVKIIEKFHPKAFYSIEDVRFASEGIFPMRGFSHGSNILGLLRLRRKGKL